MPSLRLIAIAALLATASAPAYPDERQLIGELNAVRADPAGYAADLRRIAEGYRGIYYREKDGTDHASREGAGAVIEAAADLAHQSPRFPLAPDATLRAAARDHVEAQGPTGAVGHASSAGANPGDRVRQRGGDIYVGEAIAYGVHDPAAVIRSLIVDDGVAGRGHRRLLLSSVYRYAGVWCGPHAAYGMMCVIDLSASAGGRPHIPDQ